MPDIIVASEKHATRYLDASTPEAWAKSALGLLTSRFREGYWYQDPLADSSAWGVQHRAERAQLLAMTREQIDALSDAIRSSTARAFMDAQDELREDEKAHKEYEAIRKVVESQDLSFTPGRRPVPVAWVLLSARSKAEYEGVSIEHLEEAPEPQAPTAPIPDLDTIL